MTSEPEDVYTNPETFPVGTVILTNNPFGLTFVIKEYQCLQWTKQGRCKIYDVLDDNIFWTHINPEYIILEVLPTEYVSPYQYTLTSKCESITEPKLCDFTGFDSLYNLGTGKK